MLCDEQTGGPSCQRGDTSPKRSLLSSGADKIHVAGLPPPRSSRGQALAADRGDVEHELTFGLDHFVGADQQGHSFVQGGRRRLRQALYMPAVSAISCNPDLARKYRQLCSAGKPPKVAITAVMRKLLLLANALIAKDKTWAAAVPTRA